MRPTKFAPLAALALAASLAPAGNARADDVLVPEDSLVAAAGRLDASTVVVRVSRSGSAHARSRSGRSPQRNWPRRCYGRHRTRG